MSSAQLTLRFILEGRKEVVTLPATATIDELYGEAEKVLHPSKGKSKTTAFDLLTGFPPRPLEHSTSTTLQEAGIQTQESITIRVITDANAPDLTTAASPSASRSKRAAAQKASAGFKDAIKRQDQLEREATAGKKKNDTATRSSPAKKARFTAASTTGYRLADGAVVSPSRRNRQSSTHRNRSVTGDNSDTMDSSVAFLTSATSGGRSKHARLMRTGWRSALNDAYERNKAVARLAAITAGKYKFSMTTHGSQDQDTQSTVAPSERSLQVTFAKGVQGRGDYTEIVDHIPKSALIAALASIHISHADALRPENMALLSPRVLWSVMYNAADTADGAANPSVIDAMKQLQPNLDWSFLRRRKEQLSAKARENLRQTQEAEAAAAARSGDTSEMEEWSRAAEAIASVEQAMEDMEVVGRSHFLSTRSEMEPWFVDTPNELDVDELQACIAAHPPIYKVKDWAHLLQDQCDIHNWRELANEDAEQLCEELGLDEEVCRAWIEHAQTESVDEIIVEVCNGSVDAVELLREAASCGTPKDLATFRLTVPLLREVVEAYTAEHAVNTVVPTVEELQLWCDRAYQACEQLPWLKDFITDVSARYDAS